MEKPSIQTLRQACKILDERHIKYFIVGSLAIGAITGKPIVDQNDVDILVPQDLDETRNVLSSAGLLKTKDNRSGVDLLINQYVQFDDGAPSLRYKNYKISIPSEIFTEYPVSAYGVSFKTLPPQTLFHLYLIGGSFRRDDWKNALNLGRWIKQHDSDCMSESQFENFHRYAKERQRMYPIDAYLWRLDRERNVLLRPSFIRSIKNSCPWLIPFLKQGREFVNQMIGFIPPIKDTRPKNK